MYTCAVMQMLTKLYESVNEYGSCDEMRCWDIKYQLKQSEAQHDLMPY